MGSMRLDKKPHVLAAIVVALACALVAFAPRPAWAISSQLSSNYTLTADETYSGQLQVNGTCMLDLAGHTLDLSSCSQFLINSGTLTITDSSAGKSGVIYLGNNSHIQLYGNGVGLVLEAGTIDGSKQTNGPQMGGAVYVGSGQENKASFTMTGGSIVNCKCTSSGGAVYVVGNGSFTMSGGTISNCKATGYYGGAVYVGGGNNMNIGTFTMTDGSITGCSAPKGGAVFIDGGQPAGNAQNGNFYFHGGTISGNTAGTTNRTANSKLTTLPQAGDAIYVYGNFYVSGYVNISGNVYLQNSGTGTDRPIMVDGPLCVLGTGYVDVYTEYTYTNYEKTGYEGSGYTVVKNVSSSITDLEFCSYATYFYNKTEGLSVAAGQTGGITTKTTDPYVVYSDVAGQKWAIANPSETEMRNQTEKVIIYVGRGANPEPYYYYYSLQLTKYGDGDTLLSGATFTLYKGSDANGTMLGTITTGSDGFAYLMDGDKAQKLMLDDGTYYLKETAAPTDYELISGGLTITIDHDGSPIYSISGTGTSGNHYELGGTDGILDTSTNAREFVIKAYDTKTPATTVTLNVTKAGSDGATVLSGASFGLYKLIAATDTEVTYGSSAEITNAQVGTTQTTGTDGKVSFSDVEPGTYILKETNAPAGYSLAPGIVVTVASDGTVSASQTVSGTPKTIDVTNSNLTASFTVTDNPLATLPSTGGRGMAECVLTGITLAMLAGSALVCVRRRRPRAIGGAAPGKNGSG